MDLLVVSGRLISQLEELELDELLQLHTLATTLLTHQQGFVKQEGIPAQVENMVTMRVPGRPTHLDWNQYSAALSFEG